MNQTAVLLIDIDLYWTHYKHLF